MNRKGGKFVSEENIIRHCSPTLAGMKTGNMFTQFFENEQQMKESIRELNKIFVDKGLRLIPLRWKNKKALLYLFRPSYLSRDLRNSTANRLLRERGYLDETPGKCICHLIKRLEENEDFPHEIGLFLGYPPEDVCGFIENREDECKCVGCWKVYGDAEKAQKTFAKYKKCTDVYCKQFANGRTIEQLVNS